MSITQLPRLRSGDAAQAPFSDSVPYWVEAITGEFEIRLAGDDSVLSEAKKSTTGLLARVGLTSTGDWITDDTHCALSIYADGRRAWHLWQTLWRAKEAVDVWVMPIDKPVVKLLVCDMDSTLITTESLDELAAHVGIGEQVATITARAMNGELDFVAALNERVALLAGLSLQQLNACVQHTELSQGAKTLLDAANTGGTRTVLISGGFTHFADHVGRLLDVDRVVANTLALDNNALTGLVSPPIVTQATKLDVLREERERLNLAPHEVCAIGDGANDMAMLGEAGVGVAYRAKPVVHDATPWHLDHAPLDRLTDWLDFGRAAPPQ